MRTITGTTETIRKENGEIIFEETVRKTKTDGGLDAVNIAKIIASVCGVVSAALSVLPDIIKACKKNNKESEEAGNDPLKQVELLPSVIYGQPKMSGQDDNPEFLVENIKKGGINFIGGPSGSCKSVLTTQTLNCIAHGKRSVFDVLDPKESTCKGVKAFLYDAENGRERFEKRFCQDGYSPSIEVIHKKHCRFSSIEPFLADIRERVVRYNNDCVVGVDNLTRVFPSMTDQLANKLYDGLEEIQEEMKSHGVSVTFIMVVHTNCEYQPHQGLFETSFRGSGNIVNFSDNSIGINHARGGKAHKYIKPLKERDSATDFVTRVEVKTSPIYHLVFEGNTTEGEAVEEKMKAKTEAIPVLSSSDKEKRPNAQDRELIFKMKSEGATAEEIATALKVCKRTYHYYLDRMNLEDE